MTRKFDSKEVGTILRKASIACIKEPSLRWGQAIWNCASDYDKDTMSSFCGTDFDFFYEKDEDVALGKFLDNFTFIGETE